MAKGEGGKERKRDWYSRERSRRGMERRDRTVAEKGGKKYREEKNKEEKVME